MPAAVVTRTEPVEAPAGTVAVIWPEEFTTKPAALSPNLTCVAPRKLAPKITTEVPTDPVVGEIELIDGVAVVTRKFALLVAVPPGVVTLTRPVVAPEGTVAVILIDEFTAKLAATPLNVTNVAPLRLVPLITTEVPTGPEVGENELIVGCALLTWKLALLVAVPPGVVTVMRPVVAPDGTVVMILVGEVTVKAAATPLNVTDVAPVKFEPLISTEVPTGPEVGENELIAGADPVETWKFCALVAVPAGVVTVMRPVVAPEGTVAVILPDQFTVKAAATPLNVTSVAPSKFDPLITTEVPTGPEFGENELIVGGALFTVKSEPLVAVPAGVVTLMRPVVAPEGTVAVIFVPSLTVKLAATPFNVTDVAPVKLVPLI